MTNSYPRYPWHKIDWLRLQIHTQVSEVLDCANTGEWQASRKLSAVKESLQDEIRRIEQTEIAL